MRVQYNNVAIECKGECWSYGRSSTSIVGPRPRARSLVVATTHGRASMPSAKKSKAAAARKPAGGRRPTRRHMSADGDAAPAQQTDPVLEVERLENAIAESTEPNEQKELAEKLGMSRMSAEMSVLSANAAFYDAFQSCDVAKMKAVWSDSDDVTCVHPGHPLISGADLVLNSWRALFSSAGGMPKLEAQRQRVVLRCVEINQCVGCTR